MYTSILNIHRGQTLVTWSDTKSVRRRVINLNPHGTDTLIVSVFDKPYFLTDKGV